MGPAPGAMRVEDEVPYKRQGPRCLTTFQSFLVTGILVTCATLISVITAFQLLKTGVNGACFSASRLMSTIFLQREEMFPYAEEIDGHQLVVFSPLFKVNARLRWGAEAIKDVSDPSTLVYAYEGGVNGCGRFYYYLLTPWARGSAWLVDSKNCDRRKMFELAYIAPEGFTLDPNTAIEMPNNIFRYELKRVGRTESRQLIIQDCTNRPCDIHAKHHWSQAMLPAMLPPLHVYALAEIRGLMHCVGAVFLPYHYQYVQS